MWYCQMQKSFSIKALHNLSYFSSFAIQIVSANPIQFDPNLFCGKIPLRFRAWQWGCYIQSVWLLQHFGIFSYENLSRLPLRCRPPPVASDCHQSRTHCRQFADIIPRRHRPQMNLAPKTGPGSHFLHGRGHQVETGPRNAAADLRGPISLPCVRRPCHGAG